jgi:hypothetical protein
MGLMIVSAINSHRPWAHPPDRRAARILKRSSAVAASARPQPFAVSTNRGRRPSRANSRVPLQLSLLLLKPGLSLTAWRRLSLAPKKMDVGNAVSIKRLGVPLALQDTIGIESFGRRRRNNRGVLQGLRQRQRWAGAVWTPCGRAQRSRSSAAKIAAFVRPATRTSPTRPTMSLSDGRKAVTHDTKIKAAQHRDDTHTH